MNVKMNRGIARARKIQIRMLSSSITPVIASSVEVPAAGILAVKADIIMLNKKSLIIRFMNLLYLLVYY